MIYFSILLVVVVLVLLLISFFQETHTKSFTRFMCTIVLVVSVLLSILSFITTISTGYVGIPRLFGEVRGDTLAEGIHFVNPFLSIPEMSIRTQTYTMSGKSKEGNVQGDDAIGILSHDGLRIHVDLTVAFRLNTEDAPWFYRNLGPDYVDKIVRPAIRTAIREAGSLYTFNDLYSKKREAATSDTERIMRTKIKQILSERADFKGLGIIIQQVLLRDVSPPGKVINAIEKKLQAEQEAQAMVFVLEKERREAERKEIEASGIAKFQEIVTKGISDKLIQWKGIEALRALAESSNAKVIVVGGEKAGMLFSIKDK